MPHRTDEVHVSARPAAATCPAWPPGNRRFEGPPPPGRRCPPVRWVRAAPKKDQQGQPQPGLLPAADAGDDLVGAAVVGHVQSLVAPHDEQPRYRHEEQQPGVCLPRLGDPGREHRKKAPPARPHTRPVSPPTTSQRSRAITASSPSRSCSYQDRFIVLSLRRGGTRPV